MSKPYVIDACALIDAAKNYKMTKKSFSHIWDRLDELFQSDHLISSVEIIDELRDDDLKTWVKQHRSYFHPLTPELQEKAKEILAQFPTLIQIRSTSNSNADPFLIATAIIQNGSIVTNERLGDERTADYKIPNVCRALNIPCLDLNTFLDQVLE